MSEFGKSPRKIVPPEIDTSRINFIDERVTPTMVNRFFIFISRYRF